MKGQWLIANQADKQKILEVIESPCCYDHFTSHALDLPILPSLKVDLELYEKRGM